jgi:hypothetical protein
LVRCQIEHLQPLPTKAEGVEDALGLIDPLRGLDIAIEVVTILLQTASHEHGIGTLSERLEQMQYIHPTDARNWDYQNLWRVLPVLHSGPLHRSIGSMFATVTDNMLGMAHPYSPFEAIMVSALNWVSVHLL